MDRNELVEKAAMCDRCLPPCPCGLSCPCHHPIPGVTPTETEVGRD